MYLSFLGKTILKRYQKLELGFKRCQMLRASNLALGGSLENAVVMDEFSILNPEGLRYKNNL